ncbi:MAG: Dam family site-specific DNA-(adenine-N6)-methyltransferase [Rickettsiales bacterium]|nr:Dam family site-specific DNA-(adenine-N6)-methyltransferase [Rickettsiales bacterium]
MPNIVKTPLNYTGNKSRILDQLLPLFPKNIKRFVDVCCGGASVGLNVEADQIICLDINNEVIDLLRTIKLFPEEQIISIIETLIKNFGLSDTFSEGYDPYKKHIDGNNGLKNYNKVGYLRLRDHFNTSSNINPFHKSIYLLTLISFCFNNDIRFNSAGKFNMPVGKTDFNGSIRDKLHSFKQGTLNKNIDFHRSDFSVVKELGLGKGDFVYIDPPYLITNAVYNENDSWNEKKETELLKTLDFLHARNVRFALSNVLSKSGKENSILAKWVKKNKFKIIDIDYHYRSASYNKKNRQANEREIVVLNYGL